MNLVNFHIFGRLVLCCYAGCSFVVFFCFFVKKTLASLINLKCYLHFWFNLTFTVPLVTQSVFFRVFCSSFLKLHFHCATQIWTWAFYYFSLLFLLLRRGVEIKLRRWWWQCVSEAQAEFNLRFFFDDSFNGTKENRINTFSAIQEIPTRVFVCVFENIFWENRQMLLRRKS